jgi:hypothetical protein
MSAELIYVPVVETTLPNMAGKPDFAPRLKDH